MSNYDAIQITECNRRRNNVRACMVVEIDRERGLLCRLPWGTETIRMKPRDFEVVPYKAGDWVDLALETYKRPIGAIYRSDSISFYSQDQLTR